VSDTKISTKELARRIRVHVLQMTSSGGSSHVGSAFSIADILAVCYGRIIRCNPREPAWVDRDRFILSKGHAGAAVYATLAELGYFAVENLKKHYQDGSVFSGHVSHKGIAGVELSTGSLGHGLGVGAGMAKALKLGNKTARVFVLLSDGECDEGSNWEAILFAQHHALDNLVVIIDYNKLQSLAPVDQTLALEPFREKWEAFNWNVIECDGHSHEQLTSSLSTLGLGGRPTVLIAHTTKGKGVSFMENAVLWHYRTAKGDEFDRALIELMNY
jgi:transketolase